MPLDARGVARALEQRHWVVDVRGTSEFGRSHVTGSVHVPSASKSFATYAGSVLTYDRPITLIAKSQEQAHNAARVLALIGLDDVVGWAAFDALQQSTEGTRLGSIKVIDAGALASQLEHNGPRVIDVRNRTEWNEGHLPKATHIYLGDLSERIGDADKEKPIVVHCATGSRSSIAASLLLARGFTDVVNFAGGFDAWRKAGLPVEKP